LLLELREKKIPAKFGRTNQITTNPSVIHIENPVSAFASPLELSLPNSEEELESFLQERGKKYGFSQAEIDDYILQEKTNLFPNPSNLLRA